MFGIKDSVVSVTDQLERSGFDRLTDLSRELPFFSSSFTSPYSADLNPKVIVLLMFNHELFLAFTNFATGMCGVMDIVSE